MKVLMLSGSPHEHGTTRRALEEMVSEFKVAKVDTEIMTLGNKALRGCIACARCDGRCRAFDDDVNRVLDRLEHADALVIATPVYFASPNGTLVSALDRIFTAGLDSAFLGKPAACVAVARRAGTTATLETLMKYPAIKAMPIVTSTYWPMAHGSSAAQVEQDLEGMQVLRNLARNMIWLLNCIELGKREGAIFPKPEEPFNRTDFMR